MDMAPMSLKKLFTSLEKPINARPVRLYCLFHDMSFKSLIFNYMPLLKI